MTTDIDLDIRQMCPDDLDAVLALESEVFPDAWPLGAFTDHLEAVEAGGLVVGTDGCLIGYACYQFAEACLHLTNLAVTPRLRRKSVAKRMLDHILGLARAQDCEFICLEVRESNRTARAFYEACGFKVVDRTERYYENPTEDALIMLSPVD